MKAQPAKGRSVVVQGVLASGQTGVRAWNGGHAGYGTSHFVGARGWEHAAKAADPELVVIALGTNDYTFQLTAAQFKQNLSLLVDRATASATGPVSVALMPMWTGTGRDAVRYGAYVEAQRELATTRGLGLIDLSKLDAVRYTSDGVHPNDLGQRAIADAVLSAANPRHVPFVLPPADPTDVVAAPGTSPGTATLTWTPPAGTVTDYTINAHDHAGPVTSYSATGTSATITGLTPGHTYTFGIFANNAAGQSPGVASNTITLPEALSPPADPTDVVAAPGAEPGTVTLTWTPPTGTVTDYTIVAYDLEGAPTAHHATGTSTTTTITGLTPGHTYTFAIYANNAAGQSPGVASNSVTLPASLPATLPEATAQPSP